MDATLFIDPPRLLRIQTAVQVRFQSQQDRHKVSWKDRGTGGQVDRGGEEGGAHRAPHRTAPHRTTEKKVGEKGGKMGRIKRKRTRARCS